MSNTARQLLEQMMALDETDRVEISDRLSESLVPRADSDYLEAWEKEIKARLDDIDSGQAKMIPAAEVLRKLHAEVRHNGEAR